MESVEPGVPVRVLWERANSFINKRLRFKIRLMDVDVGTVDELVAVREVPLLLVAGEGVELFEEEAAGREFFLRVREARAQEPVARAWSRGATERRGEVALDLRVGLVEVVLGERGLPAAGAARASSLGSLEGRLESVRDSCLALLDSADGGRPASRWPAPWCCLQRCAGERFLGWFRALGRK